MSDQPDATIEQVSAEAEVTADDFPDQDRFQAGEFVVMIGRAQRKEREWLKRLIPGNPLRVKGEELAVDDVIGLPVGSTLISPLGENYLLLRPTLAQRIMNMPRQAQIIYPKDLALILYWADIHPGCRAVEIGIGHGAMTMSLIRAVGPEGSLTSYEIRPDFAERTAKNVKRYLGETPWWEVKVGNPAETSVDERGVDAVLVDMPTPWEVVPAVMDALRPAGTATFFIPTVPQIMQLVDTLHQSGQFAQIQTMEAILRPWRVGGRSVRPEMHISGHTGFIVTARRKVEFKTRIKRRPPGRRPDPPETTEED